MVCCSLLPDAPVQVLGCMAQPQQRGPEYQELAGEREARWLCSAIRGHSQRNFKMLEDLIEKTTAFISIFRGVSVTRNYLLMKIVSPLEMVLESLSAKT